MAEEGAQRADGPTVSGMTVHELLEAESLVSLEMKPYQIYVYFCRITLDLFL